VAPAPLSISAAEARRIALRAQGLLGAEGRRGGVTGMLERVGAVQIDTISVLARSHELVAYARLGAVARERVEQIAAAIDDLAATSRRVHEEMSEVAAVAEETSASTEQVAASTQETTASADEITTAAGELARTAEALERLVGEFTLA
jgi:methyl-accepting chemotaxis protein